MSSIVNDMKSVQVYRNKQVSDMMSPGYFTSRFSTPPLTRWQKIKVTTVNYRRRLHRAWLVLVYDYDLAGDE